MLLIRPGDVGPEVLDVQERLAQLGLSCADEPAVYGPATKQTVQRFQQARGLPADGLVGEDTWRALVDAGWHLGDRLLYRTRPLLRGDDVRDLQRRLSQLGFDSGLIDGLFGEETEAALRDFQLNTGLDTDGRVGNATVQALLRLRRDHQEATATAVRERAAMRHPVSAGSAGKRILVDPARGPDDPGVLTPNGTPEHVVTWAIAARLEGLLAAQGMHVILSRGPGTTPTPSERAALANAEDVALILSIHGNALPDTDARGAAAYYFGADRFVSERGRWLAQLAVDGLCRAVGTPNCRIHASTAALLRESRAPAAIVEPGFLTHPVEGVLLEQRAHQARIAAALAQAVLSFLRGAEVPAGDWESPAPSAAVG